MKVFPIVLISLFVMAICACTSNSTKASPGEFVPMVLVTGGTFVYGNPLGDGDDQPAYPVVVKSFAIAKMEINQFQYKTIMGKNPSSFKGDSLPVENVTWYDAMEFCNKLSVREGYSPAYTITDTKVSLHETNTGYRLPTEIEWEFAARGGLKSKGYRYAGSNDAAAVAWYKLNSNATTHSVGTKQANELGIYDMSGNVTEWCWDWAGR